MKRKIIPIAKPELGEAEARAMARPVLSGWVAQGPEVRAFEEEFAASVGARHACAVSSGTAALHAALRSVGVGPGDEVVTVSHSFIATANSVRFCGAVPVFVDVERGSHNMDPRHVERAIGPKTRAILCVHQMGMPCDLRAIVDAASRRGLPVVEDAACAVGSEIRWNGEWQKIGRPHGTVACFSFHPRKVITTGEGGMLTTSDAALDAGLRRCRQHGMRVSAGPEGNPSGEHVVLGYNYRMTDVQAAMGREQLRRLPGIVARRRDLAGRYGRILADIPGLELPVEPGWARSNWQSYCVRLPDGCDPREVARRMLEEGVSTRPGVSCAHREEAYDREPWSCGRARAECRCAPRTCVRLAESESAQDRCLLLPLFCSLTEAEQDVVASALRGACGQRSR